MLPKSSFEVGVYRDERGNSAFHSWFAALDNVVATKVTTARNRTATLPFRELVEKRVRQEPGFGAALLQEALERLLVNDVASAQLLLREVFNGMIGFQALAKATGLMEKSLMRMLSTKGNPQARNLFLILHAIQSLAGVRLEVKAAVDVGRDFAGRK